MGKLKEERGELLLESTYCIIISMFVVFVLLALSFMLYQRAIFTVVSNQVADQAVQLYKYTDPTLADSGDLKETHVLEVGLYRYLFKKGDMQNTCVVRTKNLMETRLTETSFAQQGGYMVTIEPISDDVLGRRHFKVSVTAQYGLFMEAFLDAAGMQNMGQMSTVVYVEGYDMLAHMNTIQTSKYLMNKVTDNGVGNLVESIFKTISSTLSLLKTLFG